MIIIHDESVLVKSAAAVAAAAVAAAAVSLFQFKYYSHVLFTCLVIVVQNWMRIVLKFPAFASVLPLILILKPFSRLQFSFKHICGFSEAVSRALITMDPTYCSLSQLRCQYFFFNLLLSSCVISEWSRPNHRLNLVCFFTTISAVLLLWKKWTSVLKSQNSFPFFYLQRNSLMYTHIISYVLFSHRSYLMVFHWKSNGSNSTQYSRTLLSILNNFSNAVIWIISISRYASISTFSVSCVGH